MADVADVAIVGSGPAGLFSALELSDASSKLSVLVFERGLRTVFRSCPPHSEKCMPCETCDVVSGLGGPGFYIDGKLCLDDNVGTKLEGTEGVTCASIDNRIAQLLRKYRIPSRLVDPSLQNSTKLVADLAELGIATTTYPVRELGSDSARDLAEALYGELTRKGVAFRFGSDVREVEHSDGIFYISVADLTGAVSAVRARYVILCPGRSGTDLIADVATRFALQTTLNPLDVGVRLEARSEDLADIARLGANPKLKFPWRGTYVKTHCLCPRGFVLSYRLIIPGVATRVVDGHSFSRVGSPNSNINLLMRIEPSWVADPVQFGTDLITQTNLVGRGSPIVQTLADFMDYMPTDAKGLLAASVSPTLQDATPGNIGLSYPDFVSAALREFITTLSSVFPGVGRPGNLLYSPALEWRIRRIEVSPNMETECRNLFIAGDGAGITQGVVAAAITGVIAAREILRREAG